MAPESTLKLGGVFSHEEWIEDLTLICDSCYEDDHRERVWYHFANTLFSYLANVTSRPGFRLSVSAQHEFSIGKRQGPPDMEGIRELPPFFLQRRLIFKQRMALPLILVRRSQPLTELIISPKRALRTSKYSVRIVVPLND